MELNIHQHHHQQQQQHANQLYPRLQQELQRELANADTLMIPASGQGLLKMLIMSLLLSLLHFGV
jgi:hypothetical protein